MIEDKAINIVDMNLKYSQLVSFLLEASQNTADFMQSYILPFGDATKVKRDVVLEELLKPHAADDTVKIILKVTLPAIAKVCQHLFTDHLQGGKYAECACWHSEAQQVLRVCLGSWTTWLGQNQTFPRCQPKRTSCLPTTRLVPGFNDASTQEAILKAASLDVKRVRASFAIRREEIVTARRAKVQAALKKTEELKARKLQQLEQYTNDIIEVDCGRARRLLTRS